MTNLKILLTDLNALTHLPPSIGQCRGLRILNLASNNLLYLPDEIGQLVELRVLNLANNFLRFLPESVKRLTNLSALWLNDNQKKPLVALEPDFDHQSNTQVLTCMLFPQTGPILGPISAAVLSQIDQANQEQKYQASSTSPAHHVHVSGMTAQTPASRRVNKPNQPSPVKAGPLSGVVELRQAQAHQKQQLPKHQFPRTGPFNTNPHQATTHLHHPALAGGQMLDEEEERGVDLLQSSNTLERSGAYPPMPRSLLDNRHSLIEMSGCSTGPINNIVKESGSDSETAPYALR